MRKSNFENKNLNGTLSLILKLTKFHRNVQWFHSADIIKSWKKPTKIKYYIQAKLNQETNSILKIKENSRHNCYGKRNDEKFWQMTNGK